jgi:hypothetical protein
MRGEAAYLASEPCIGAAICRCCKIHNRKNSGGRQK